MQVWIVLVYDLIDSVFDTEAKAQAYAATKGKARIDIINKPLITVLS